MLRARRAEEGMNLVLLFRRVDAIDERVVFFSEPFYDFASRRELVI